MSSILEWCKQDINEENHEQAFFVLEKLFQERCSEFLSDRTKHGFSLTSFSPTVTPSLSVIEKSDYGADQRQRK